MSTSIYVVNAFCITGDDGNPAGVCLLPDGDADAAWMQRVARQMNLPETAFVRRRDANRYAIRWFSPAKEIPLCGHATLASTHVLYEQGLVDDGPIEFIGATGPLIATKSHPGIELDFPAIPCAGATVPDWFEPAFGMTPVRFLAGRGKYLAEVSSAQEVLGLAPNFDVLRRSGDRGVIVTSRSADDAYDIVSRYFASYVGVDEDPVTGSAHCCLGPYWSALLDKTRLRAHQASPRGGRLLVRTEGDRVHLAGEARTVLAGRLLI